MSDFFPGATAIDSTSPLAAKYRAAAVGLVCLPMAQLVADRGIVCDEENSSHGFIGPGPGH
jgi:hypothetical protein